MTVATLGGIILVIGAYFVFKGKMFEASIVYFIADICWFTLAIQNNDYLGALLVTIGTLLSMGAFYKMHKGIFHKSLKKENNG